MKLSELIRRTSKPDGPVFGMAIEDAQFLVALARAARDHDLLAFLALRAALENDTDLSTVTLPGGEQ